MAGYANCSTQQRGQDYMGLGCVNARIIQENLIFHTDKFVNR